MKLEKLLQECIMDYNGFHKEPVDIVLSKGEDRWEANLKGMIIIEPTYKKLLKAIIKIVITRGFEHLNK